MNRARALIVVVALVVFVAAGGIIIRANSGGGGANRTFSVTVSKATSMSPNTLQAHVNDSVTINVRSDEDGEVHLHVYNIAFDVTAGQTTSHTFKADRTCTCDIEWEETGQPLGTLVVGP